ncbi:medium chain dehydrogenase/reductase family protein [Paenibacillus sp.]|jgi:NADPH:quinone reductase-like Zn-dependent oxidoreductase|uniref:medium chain dehydrogenase/reductase family protein n=1 Tax=Paenibacillus sp. TaxID=58172 RepID=UPI002821B2C2|nr:medium chain dehydrogenase/reductase family protein [Paenibacillus sp.]MDR0267726.1 medium chain dehydrogenase/reductase family protein [Paenibacillus sp.]
MMNVRVVVTKYGGPEALEIVDEPLRRPQRDEVRVRVQSAGVALADIMRREGKYPNSPATPFTPGYDAVGIVDDLGEDVLHVQKGDRVAVFYNGTGGYAAYVYAKADELYPVPAQIDSSAASAVILNYVTAYQMLHRLASVSVGDRILIHGASGGTGTALLELGRLAGAQMIGTASAAKHDIVTRYGAIPIDYRTEDFVKIVREKTPEGVDAVFDPIGGNNWERSFQTLSTDGRFVGYGYTSVLGQSYSGGWANDWANIQDKKMTPEGNPAYMYSSTMLRKEQPNWFREDLAHVFDLLAKGHINPVIAARIPLREAVQAHKLLETSLLAGKIVLISS